MGRKIIATDAVTGTEVEIELDVLSDYSTDVDEIARTVAVMASDLGVYTSELFGNLTLTYGDGSPLDVAMTHSIVTIALMKYYNVSEE